MSFADKVLRTALNPESLPIQLDGDGIVSQIFPQFRGALSLRERAPDVRVILKTAATGANHIFANHAYPDNKPSEVVYDGSKALMIMPARDTPRAQLFAARQIVEAVKNAGLQDGITPEFIDNTIVKPEGKLRKFTAQIYGPAPFDAQAGRLVDVAIPGAGGGSDIVKPDRGAGYAVGMRAAEKEEAFMIICEGSPDEVFVKGGKQAATAMSIIGDAMNVKLNGANTAAEQLKSFNTVAVGIVVAIDKVSSGVKPIRLETAREIFDVESLNQLRVNRSGIVTHQFMRMTPDMAVTLS